MKRTHQIALIIDMRSYQNQVTSLTMFTSNYLLFIFNLLSSHRFYLKYPQNISYHHSTSPSGWAEEWMKLSSIDSSSSNLKLDSVQATIEGMRWLRLKFQHFQKEQLCVAVNTIRLIYFIQNLPNMCSANFSMIDFWSADISLPNSMGFANSM